MRLVKRHHVQVVGADFRSQPQPRPPHRVFPHLLRSARLEQHRPWAQHPHKAQPPARRQHELQPHAPHPRHHVLPLQIGPFGRAGSSGGASSGAGGEAGGGRLGLRHLRHTVVQVVRPVDRNGHDAAARNRELLVRRHAGRIHQAVARQGHHAAPTDKGVSRAPQTGGDAQGVEGLGQAAGNTLRRRVHRKRERRPGVHLQSVAFQHGPVGGAVKRKRRKRAGRGPAHKPRPERRRAGAGQDGKRLGGHKALVAQNNVAKRQTAEPHGRRKRRDDAVRAAQHRQNTAAADKHRQGRRHGHTGHRRRRPQRLEPHLVARCGRRQVHSGSRRNTREGTWVRRRSNRRGLHVQRPNGASQVFHDVVGERGGDLKTCRW